MSIKQLIILFWILFLVSCLSFLCFNPQLFEPQAIADFLNQFNSTVFIVYCLLCVTRGFTLLPSTPLVLAGTILFPNEPYLVLFISILGIMFSSTMIYYFSDYLGFGEYLEKKHSQRIVKIKDQMQKQYGVWLVFLWSFIPFLPTDAICYVAGTIKMNFRKFIVAMTFGELIICTVYIFFYTSLIKPIL
jgi:uncharacterized membrane protein YdjX (TVP38/TMEM64 family)